MKNHLPIALLCLLLALPASLAAESSGFPDNHTIRQRLADVIHAPTDRVLSTPSGVYNDLEQGNDVKFQVVTQGAYYYLVFTNGQHGSFPLDSRGSYIIKRSKKNGSFIQVKIFLNGTPGSYVRIFPMGSRSRMNLYLYGFRMYTNVNIPLSFREIVIDPFSKVMALTAGTVDWSLVLPDRPLPEDRTVEAMVRTIRERLPRLLGHSSGGGSVPAYLEKLRALSHDGFVCSGLAKWVIDGLYQPRTGHTVSVAKLEREHRALRSGVGSSPMRKNQDPFFGLDWARNLALALTRLDDPSVGLHADDVAGIPFFPSVRNVGYPVAKLKLILYLLAVKDPGYLYLGAVNRQSGHEPVRREFTHVVVLLPYFGPSGNFHAVVLDGNGETGVASVVRRYPEDYIFLARVRASRDFSPPIP